jgi:hypothetical protein
MEEDGGARVNPFEVLPEELSVRILRELSADALVNASAVCAQVPFPSFSVPSMSNEDAVLILIRALNLRSGLCCAKMKACGKEQQLLLLSWLRLLHERRAPR